MQKYSNVEAQNKLSNEASPIVKKRQWFFKKKKSFKNRISFYICPVFFLFQQNKHKLNYQDIWNKWAAIHLLFIWGVRFKCSGKYFILFF